VMLRFDVEFFGGFIVGLIVGAVLALALHG